MILRWSATAGAAPVVIFIVPPQVCADIGAFFIAFPFGGRAGGTRGVRGRCAGVFRLARVCAVCSVLKPSDCGFVNCSHEPPVKFYWRSFRFQLTFVWTSFIISLHRSRLGLFHKIDWSKEIKTLQALIGYFDKGNCSYLFQINSISFLS